MPRSGGDRKESSAILRCGLAGGALKDGKSTAENQSSASASASRTRPGQTESGGEEREEGTARAWPAAERVGGGEERERGQSSVEGRRNVFRAKRSWGLCAERETRRDETRRGTQKEVILF